MIKKFVAVVILCFALLTPRESHALTLGEGAIILGVFTGAGAVLGLSTLPFYGEPSEHKSNIWTGAAIGAVAGVLTAAYLGFVSGRDSIDFEEEEAIEGGTQGLLRLDGKSLLAGNRFKFSDSPRVKMPNLNLTGEDVPLVYGTASVMF